MHKKEIIHNLTVRLKMKILAILSLQFQKWKCIFIKNHEDTHANYFLIIECNIIQNVIQQKQQRLLCTFIF